MIAKWAALILMFFAALGESQHDQLRNCPALNDEPHHIQNDNNTLSNLKGLSTSLTAAKPLLLRKWTKGAQFDGKYEVPYKIKSSLPFKVKEAIYFAMVIIERGTNIIFVKKRQTDRDYIFLMQPRDDYTCSSMLGRNWGQQIVRLPSHCWKPEDILHELFHVLGLAHEHQRIDRSIYPGLWEEGDNESPNFTLIQLTPYDPFSITHYVLPRTKSLRTEDNWTWVDTQLAHIPRAFPSICDYSGINELYKGHVKSPPCTDPRIRPMLLRGTQEGSRRWEEAFPSDNRAGRNLTWACNYMSGRKFHNESMFNFVRDERTLCQFQENSMYPNFWWVPYAEEITYPVPGLNYSIFQTDPVKVKTNWMTHDICDCLGPPPSFTNALGDQSMYQKCLECVHFGNTTNNVIKCIARGTGSYDRILLHLQENYNKTEYYLRNPKV